MGVVGTALKKGWGGLREVGRAALIGSFVDNGNEGGGLATRIGGAIGESARSVTFDKMGTLGKAITNKKDKSRGGKSPTGGSGVQGTSTSATPIKTDNVIEAINQSTNQIVGAINTLNATQRMGYNALVNQIQAQEQVLQSLEGYGEDTVLALRDIIEILGGQGYEDKAKYAGEGSGGQKADAVPNTKEDSQSFLDTVGNLVLLGETAAGIASILASLGIAGTAAVTAIGTIGGILSWWGANWAEGEGGKQVNDVIQNETKATGMSMTGAMAGPAGEAAVIANAGDPEEAKRQKAQQDRLADAPWYTRWYGIGAPEYLAEQDKKKKDSEYTSRMNDREGGTGVPVAPPKQPDTGSTELTQDEITRLVNSLPTDTTDAELMAAAKKMYPGRKYNSLKKWIDMMHQMMGTSPQSSLTSNTKLASNEVMPGMLGSSGGYLSARQAQLDTSRQGSSNIPVLQSTYGPDTSEGSLRQEEQRLEDAAKKDVVPDTIKIESRKLVYETDEITFNTDNLTFIYKKKEEKEEKQDQQQQQQQQQQENAPATPPPAATPGAGAPPAGAAPGAPSAGAPSGGGTTPGAAPGTVTGIQETGKGYNVLQLADGTVEKRTGDRNWRNNNPGNLEYGDFAKQNGAIGTDGRFAIFPSFEAGEKAQEKLLFEGKGYRGMTIAQAISRYAPPNENNTGKYISTVASAAGVSPDTPLANLTPEQRKAMLTAMHKVEGFKQGKIETLKKGTGTATPATAQASAPTSSQAAPPAPAPAGTPLEQQNKDLQKSTNQAIANRISGGRQGYSPVGPVGNAGAPAMAAAPATSSSSIDPPLPSAYQQSSGTAGTGQDLATQATSSSGVIAAATKMLGMNESKDLQSLQAFLNQYSGTPPLPINTDEGPWCAKFVNGVLGSQGMPGTGSNAAKSFLSYGSPIYDKASGQGDPKQAQPGDIAIFSRGNDPSKGHVAFVESVSGNKINIIGGNQGGKKAGGGGVTRESRDMSKLLAVRRPNGSGAAPVANAAVPSASGGGGGGAAPAGGGVASSGGGGAIAMGGGSPGGMIGGMVSSMLGGMGGGMGGMLGGMLGGLMGGGGAGLAAQGSSSMAAMPASYSPSGESGASSSSSSTGSSGGSGGSKEAMDFFISKGWSKEQAAGIVGNLMVESGNFSDSVISGKKKGDGGKAVGVAQWHPDRQAQFKKLYGKPLIGSSLKEQLEFINWELNNSEKAAGAALKQAKTAEEAAAIVDKKYERSSGQALQQRQKNAAQLVGGQFTDPSSSTSGGGGGGDASGVTPTGGATGGGSSAGGMSAMLGGGSSPFGSVGGMLGGLVNSMSKTTSLASAAPPAPSTTNIVSGGSNRFADNSRRDMPSIRNPSPGQDDTLADLIKSAFG